MRHALMRPARLAALALPLLLAAPAAAADREIPIIVDGLPLDAKAILMREDVYVPAWILENYARTRVNWRKGSNVLEILTAAPEKGPIVETEGRLRVRIGVYLESEGFIGGATTRLFVLNVDPKEFRFPDGKSPADRAHEGAIERIGKSSRDIHDYLALSPAERFSPNGWRIVSRIPNSDIANLAGLVEKYEILYRSLYFDLLTNLVINRAAQLRESAVVDETLKGVTIEAVPVSESGTAEFKVPNGLHFLFARMLYRNRQVVWDIPVSVRGGETSIELSNRNAAMMQ